MAQPVVHNYIALVAVYHFSFYLCIWIPLMSRVDTYLYIYQIYVSMLGVIENWEDWKCQVNVDRFFSFYILVFYYYLLQISMYLARQARVTPHVHHSRL